MDMYQGNNEVALPHPQLLPYILLNLLAVKPISLDRIKHDILFTLQCAKTGFSLRYFPLAHGPVTHHDPRAQPGFYWPPILGKVIRQMGMSMPLFCV